jgi:hypothetical protein
MDYLRLSSFSDVACVFRTYSDEFCTLICIAVNNHERVYRLDLTKLLREICTKSGISYRIYMNFHEDSNVFLIRFVNTNCLSDFKGEIIDSSRINENQPCLSVKHGVLYPESIKNISGKNFNLFLKFDSERLHFCLELIRNDKHFEFQKYIILTISVLFSLYFYIVSLGITHDGRHR